MFIYLFDFLFYLFIYSFFRASQHVEEVADCFMYASLAVITNILMTHALNAIMVS